MASYGLAQGSGLSNSVNSSYQIQSNLEHLIANHVIGHHDESGRRLSDSSQHAGLRPHIHRSQPSMIAEEQPLLSSDDEDDTGHHRSHSHPRTPSLGEHEVSEHIAKAYSRFTKSPRLSMAGSFHQDRRASVLSNFTSEDRSRLSKLTSIVSGVEVGDEPDETHLASRRHSMLSPKFGGSFGFTPLPEPATPQLEDPDDWEAKSTYTDTHMLLDPAQELDPVADLELPGKASNSYETNWPRWRKFIGQPAFLEAYVLLRNTAPILGTQLLEYSLPLASVISIGHLSTTDLAASTLANMTAAVTGYSLLQGFVGALDLVMPSAWTSSEPQRVGFWLQRCAICVGFLLIPMIALWLQAESVLLVLRQEPEVAYRAGVYLRYLSIGLPGFAVNQMMRKYYQAQNLQHVPQYISMIVAPFNVLFNGLLVWGPDAIRLGFIGAPLTTALSFNLSAVLAVVWAMYFAPKTAWAGWGGFSRSDVRFLLTTGAFGAIQVASEWWAWEICGLMVSMLGQVPLAVNSVLLSFSSILFQVPSSAGNAAANRIGNLLGANLPQQANLSSKVAMVLAIIASCINSSILVLSKDHVGWLFTSDPLVVEQTSKLMIYVALFQIADALVGLAGGVMRVLSLIKAGAIINLIAYYIIGLPIGAYLCFKLDMGLRGLWTGLTIGIFFAGTASGLLILRVDWDVTVENVRRKLGLSSAPAAQKPVASRTYGTIE